MDRLQTAFAGKRPADAAVDAGRFMQGATHGLEYGFEHMMLIHAVIGIDMQIESTFYTQGLEKLLGQVCIKITS